MEIRLHKNGATTLKVREEIQKSNLIFFEIYLFFHFWYHILEKK